MKNYSRPINMDKASEILESFHNEISIQKAKDSEIDEYLISTTNHNWFGNKVGMYLTIPVKKVNMVDEKDNSITIYLKDFKIRIQKKKPIVEVEFYHS